jgi:hypothetical protein
LKMDLTEGSETSEKLNLTPGKYPKENIQDSEHGENLKSRIFNRFFSHLFSDLSKIRCKISAHNTCIVENL